MKLLNYINTKIYTPYMVPVSNITALATNMLYSTDIVVSPYHFVTARSHNPHRAVNVININAERSNLSYHLPSSTTSTRYTTTRASDLTLRLTYLGCLPISALADPVTKPGLDPQVLEHLRETASNVTYNLMVTEIIPQLVIEAVLLLSVVLFIGFFLVRACVRFSRNWLRDCKRYIKFFKVGYTAGCTSINRSWEDYVCTLTDEERREQKERELRAAKKGFAAGVVLTGLVFIFASAGKPRKPSMAERAGKAAGQAISEHYQPYAQDLADNAALKVVAENQALLSQALKDGAAKGTEKAIKDTCNIQ